MKSQNGFSLIELVIVVVIVGILATLAATGLLASRRSANEGSTVSSLRLLHGAQMTYQSSFGAGEFAGLNGPPNLNAFNTLRSHELIDSVLGVGSKSGYNFLGAREVSTPTSPAQFFFSAIPVSPDPVMGTGIHRFGISTDGVVRTDTTISAHFADVNAVSTAPAMGN